MAKAHVIINESHSLLPEQEQILNAKFDDLVFVKVPQSGWTLDEMKKVAEDLHIQASEAHIIRDPDTGETILYSADKAGNAVVFVSPIPYLLKYLSQKAIFADERGKSKLYDVLVFHNDNREKKELPDGKIIQTVAKTGWQLV